MKKRRYNNEELRLPPTDFSRKPCIIAAHHLLSHDDIAVDIGRRMPHEAVDEAPLDLDEKAANKGIS